MTIDQIMRTAPVIPVLVLDGDHDWVKLAETFVGARIWGPSARFDGQKVGREHRVLDGDTVELLKPM